MKPGDSREMRLLEGCTRVLLSNPPAVTAAGRAVVLAPGRVQLLSYPPTEHTPCGFTETCAVSAVRSREALKCLALEGSGHIGRSFPPAEYTDEYSCCTYRDTTAACRALLRSDNSRKSSSSRSEGRPPLQLSIDITVIAWCILHLSGSSEQRITHRSAQQALIRGPLDTEAAQNSDTAACQWRVNAP